MPADDRSPAACPACGTDARGRFCPACGTLARAMPCRSCGSTVAPGERYCGDCGAPVGEARRAGGSAEPWRPSTTWKVTTAALALTLAVALYLRFAAPSGSAPTMPLGGAGSPAGNPLAMPPQQQADALFNRVMRLNGEGKQDSVQFFAPMALQVYEQLRPWDAHRRYDVGTVALAAGMHGIARAQADSILLADPDHLLGLALLSRVGRASNRPADVARADAHFARIVEGEVRKAPEKPEYADHKADIEVEVRRLADGPR